MLAIFRDSVLKLVSLNIWSERWAARNSASLSVVMSGGAKSYQITGESHTW